MTVVDVEVTGVAAGGDGVGRLPDGRAVFVRGALPGERVAVAITEEKPRFARASVVDVVTAAAGRVAPPCPLVAAGCGGCGWQHVDLATQRELKATIVGDALRRIGRLAADDVPAIGLGPDLPATAFRTTVRAAVVGDDGRAALRSHHSHDPVELAGTGCLVAHPLVDQVLRDGRFGPAVTEVTVRAGAATGERLVVVGPSAGAGAPAGGSGAGGAGVSAGGSGTSGADPSAGTGAPAGWPGAGGAGARAGGSGAGGPGASAGGSGAGGAGAQEAGSGAGGSGEADGVAVSDTVLVPYGIVVPEGVVVVGADELAAGHRAWLHEDVAGRRWRISAGSFFQARPDGAAALAELVADAALTGLADATGARVTDGTVGQAHTGRVVVDLYGGVGLLGGVVADRADGPIHLQVVEANRSAVADARENLADLGDRAKVVRADVRRWRPSPADVVLADPSRHGLGADVVDRIVATGAGTVVLVSCDAGALGRDAGLLHAHGYRLVTAILVDLFPHTPHVEVVTAWRRDPAVRSAP